MPARMSILCAGHVRRVPAHARCLDHRALDLLPAWAPGAATAGKIALHELRGGFCGRACAWWIATRRGVMRNVDSIRYSRTAADGSTQDYRVTVSVASSSAKAITQYQFLSAKHPTLDGNVTATITGNAIAATVPFGTDLGALVATFTTTGARVTVDGDLQDSGVTANDFSMPLAYTVAAADDSIAVFTITVTVAPPAKAITAYRFEASKNPGLASDVIAKIVSATASATPTSLEGLLSRRLPTGPPRSSGVARARRYRCSDPGVAASRRSPHRPRTRSAPPGRYSMQRWPAYRAGDPRRPGPDQA
jgi:hypothetical protein